MDLSEEQKKLFIYVDSLVGDDGHLSYDFRDPKQYAFATMMAGLSGDSDRYPGRVQTLARIQKNQVENGSSLSQPAQGSQSGWQNMFIIPGLGRSKVDGKAASNGFGTIVGGYSSMNLTLVIQDNKTHNIVAHGFSNDFADKFLPVQTTPSPTEGDDLDVTAYLHYSYTGKTSKNDPEAFGNSSGVVKRTMSDGPTADPVLTAPLRTTTNPLNPKAINIGLGRRWTDQGGNSQFDYAWNEPTENHPVGKIPFVGSVTFGSKIRTPLTPRSGLYLDIYVADKSGGGGAELAPADMDTVYSAFSIDGTNPNKLNWNLPPGVSTTDPGNPIVFGHVTWSSNLLAYFYCGISVVMDDGNLAFAAVQSQDTHDEDPLDGTLEIMPIEFIWHCLGEGTVVSMADGTAKPIEQVLAGDRVLTSNGEATVVWTNKGIHKGSAIEVRTDQGQQIVASDNHIFITDDGPRQADELRLGGRVMVDGGDFARITHIERKEAYDGQMYNLATRDFQDAHTSDGQIATFIANGFVVADMNAQKARVYHLRRDIAHVKAQVPDYLHPDVDAFFEDHKF